MHFAVGDLGLRRVPNYVLVYCIIGDAFHMASRSIYNSHSAVDFQTEPFPQR